MKSQSGSTQHITQDVAPHVGAWIEIVLTFPYGTTKIVAPHVGAWIEMQVDMMRIQLGMVAPHVGAWIEILYRNKCGGERIRRSPRGSVD